MVFWCDSKMNLLLLYLVAAYAVVNHPLHHSQQPKQYLARVAFEYIAQGDEELSLKVGEIIEVCTE